MWNSCLASRSGNSPSNSSTIVVLRRPLFLARGRRFTKILTYPLLPYTQVFRHLHKDLNSANSNGLTAHFTLKKVLTNLKTKNCCIERFFMPPSHKASPSQQDCKEGLFLGRGVGVVKVFDDHLFP